jgi:hypothetical protein
MEGLMAIGASVKCKIELDSLAFRPSAFFGFIDRKIRKLRPGLNLLP